MKYTERERELLNNWPTVTEQDLERMNDLFSHYLFFRRVNTLGLRTIDLRASCCGHRETRPELVRTETPEHRELLDHLRHKEAWTCPWCGRKVTMIDLNKAGKRKRLVQTELTLLLHADGEALYADALALQKNYADDAALTARPTAWCSSGYRFAKGEVMQADYQVTYRENEPYITYERDKLSRRKEVQEPFKFGSLCWYQYQSYRILNREALEEHPFFRYCGFFNRWEYRIGGGRGYKAYFSDFVSYLTAYSIYPRQMEMLSKAGYWQPILDLIFERKKNAAAMCWEEENPKKAFGLDKRELALFMGTQPPLEVLVVRNYVRRHWGKTWSLPFCMDFCNLWGCNLPPMEVLRFAKRYGLDLARMLRYFGGVFDEDHIEMVTYADLFEIYRDYLDAAWSLGYCLEHSKVLWPDQFFSAHDAAMEKLANKNKETQARNLKARRLKYEFELDGLKIAFPVTTAAIKREGRVLDHCVGGYADRHMKGVTTILFLRRVDQPHTPYVTLEMDGNRIRQIHGYHNDTLPGSQNPRVVHRTFLNTWLRWLESGSKRNEDGTPKLPKRKKAVEHEKQARTA